MRDGLAIRLAYSKTDQEAIGDTIGAPYAAARISAQYARITLGIEASDITEGPYFGRSPVTAGWPTSRYRQPPSA